MISFFTIMKNALRSVTIWVIMINITVFLVQMILGDAFTNAFMLISSDVYTRPWILLTSMFLHGDINHILFNMYGLFLFGTLLEGRIGSKRFLYLYLFTGIMASYLASFFYPAALGASGAVMGIVGALIILMPDLQLLLFFIIPMPLWIAGIVWAAIDAIGILFPMGVANIAHLAGMGVGLLYGFYLKKKKVKYQKKFVSKSHLDEDDIDEYMKTGRI
jgi:membrane associated rhomboid family serine protease